uniref:Heterokaryon incompatibility domain-containing protein n=1 Tax=Noctiluca scintillans TaxID=2966 RepID=A0A7S1A343_NOCSC|mmetsp:Transcript_29947/g.79834  ORF Transcript_29947/g.79834 Transcript_29947/m.79834 type:complete len:488 (+) Transcript_29947:68-1531(+)
MGANLSGSDSLHVFLVPRAWFLQKDEPKLLPHQEMKDALEVVNFTVEDVVKGKGDVIVVSHRWGEKHHPDPDGEQLRAIQAFLEANPGFRFVWIDFCCIPQDLKTSEGNLLLRRTEAETVYFRRALSSVNMLYLFFPVLTLLDAEYNTRFWCCFESFLAVHTFDGASLVSSGTKHFHIQCVGSYGRNRRQMQQLDKKRLVVQWTCSTQEALHVLEGSDISVTNESDKREQLDRLKGLGESLREVPRPSEQLDACTFCGVAVSLSACALVVVLAWGFAGKATPLPDVSGKPQPLQLLSTKAGLEQMEFQRHSLFHETSLAKQLQAWIQNVLFATVPLKLCFLVLPLVAAFAWRRRGESMKRKCAAFGPGCPLHEAAAGGHKEEVQLLLGKVAINEKDHDGDTALHVASLQGHLEVAQLLLDRGALHTKDNDGYTPLHWAATMGHCEVVELLLARGAKVNEVNNDGFTSLALASSSEVAELLRKLGARE